MPGNNNIIMWLQDGMQCDRATKSQAKDSQHDPNGALLDIVNHLLHIYNVYNSYVCQCTVSVPRQL